jgi:hypothetical protein
MTVLKPSREIYLFKLGTKQFFFKNKMIKKKYHTIDFKG